MRYLLVYDNFENFAAQSLEVTRDVDISLHHQDVHLHHPALAERRASGWPLQPQSSSCFPTKYFTAPGPPGPHLAHATTQGIVYEHVRSP